MCRRKSDCIEADKFILQYVVSSIMSFCKTILLINWKLQTCEITADELIRFLNLVSVEQRITNPSKVAKKILCLQHFLHTYVEVILICIMFF